MRKLRLFTDSSLCAGTVDWLTNRTIAGFCLVYVTANNATVDTSPNLTSETLSECQKRVDDTALLACVLSYSDSSSRDECVSRLPLTKFGLGVLRQLKARSHFSATAWNCIFRLLSSQTGFRISLLRSSGPRKKDIWTSLHLVNEQITEKVEIQSICRSNVLTSHIPCKLCNALRKSSFLFYHSISKGMTSLWIEAIDSKRLSIHAYFTIGERFPRFVFWLSTKTVLLLGILQLRYRFASRIEGVRSVLKLRVNFGTVVSKRGKWLRHIISENTTK